MTARSLVHGVACLLISCAAPGQGSKASDVQRQLIEAVRTNDALLNGHVETAKVLVRAGANFDLQGVDGKSSRDVAGEKGLKEILEQMNSRPRSR